MSSIKKIIKIVFLLILLGLVIYFFEKSYPFTFRIGMFKYSVPKSSIWTPVEESQHFTTQIDTGEDECVDVSGVNFISLEKKLKEYQSGLSIQRQREFSPKFYIYNWNNENLKYRNEITKQIVQKRLDALNNLMQIEDSNNLKQITLSSNFDPINRNNENKVSADPWDHVTSCGGAWSVPIYIQKIETNKFEEAIYIETFEGQDYGYPLQKIIIREGKNYLIISIPQPTGTFSKEERINIARKCSENKGISQQVDIFKCIEKDWSENHHDINQINETIKQTINSIKFVQN